MGTLVTDFYAGYNHTDGKHQRCWVHLLRDLRELDQDHSAQHPELPAWISAVIQTYRDGKAFVDRTPAPTPAERQTLFDALVERVSLGAGGRKIRDIRLMPCANVYSAMPTNCSSLCANRG